MEKSIVIALHGFLGLPSDWQKWHQTYAPGKELVAIDLWNDEKLNSSLSLNDWINSFLKIVQNYRKQKTSVELWGYSMGGRLALGALASAPDLFSRAMILSANPGLKQDNDRASRFQRDLVWAEKSRTQDWNSLMQEWHQQPVLKEPRSVDNSVYRRETDYSRDQLAQALVNWSVAKQPNYWPQMNDLQIPIDWHVGSFDQTYKAIAENVAALNSNVRLHIHHDRGHRILI
jgi:2-succinyl-6-hydroxy-2,4-cyclohexadiene-1-carboxylate synthase